MIGLPDGALIRARDHRGPVATHPIIATPTSTGANHQYLRTGDWLLIFFFLLTGGPAMISFSKGAANSGEQIRYNPNSSFSGSGPERRCAENQAHDSGPPPSAIQSNANSEE